MGGALGLPAVMGDTVDGDYGLRNEVTDLQKLLPLGVSRLEFLLEKGGLNAAAPCLKRDFYLCFTLICYMSPACAVPASDC